MPLLASRPKSSSNVVDGDPHWLEEASYALDHTTDTEIVVNLSSLQTIRSSQLNDLIRMQVRARQAARRLVLENVQDQLWQVFTVTRLDRMFEIRETRDSVTS